MNFKFCLLAFVMIASPAWAEWRFVAGSETRGTEFFIDTDSIRKEGSFVRVWELTNYLPPRVLNNMDVFSMRTRVEYDCKQDKSRVLTIAIFANPYARDLIRTETQTLSWEDVAPQTIQWDLYQRACKAPAR